MTRFRAACVAALLAVIPLAMSPSGAGPSQAGGERIVAVGDIHGSFDAFVEILRTAGLIDAKSQWSGGRTVFIQTGDIFDRGGKVRQTLDLLMRLEDEAKRAGGRVEVLLGNHEAMNLLHEFRDVSTTAYTEFVDARSEPRRQRAYEEYVTLLKRKTPPVAPPEREPWMAAHPPGFFEHAEALGPRGKYGRWLRSRKVMLVEQRTAFMHAGLDMKMAATVDEINKTAAAEINRWDDTKAAMVKARLVPAYCTLPEAIEAAVAELNRVAAALKASEPPGDHVTREFVEQLQGLLAVGKSSLFDPEGPLWFRGFAQWPETPETLENELAPLLGRFNVDRFVTGHTPSQTGRVVARFGNRIILIDTGMVFKGGRASAVEIADGRLTAIYTDSRVPIVTAAAQ
jgi:hypothetical protein